MTDEVRAPDDRLELRHHLVHQIADAERRHVQRHPAGLDAGDVEDVVDEREQVPRVRVDPRQALALRVGHLAR